MKDFFSRQEDARRQSGRLLLLFAMAVIGVALAVYLAAAVARLWLLADKVGEPGFWHPQLFLWTTTGTLAFVATVSLWKINELREGGARIAATLGGRPVPTFTQAPQERMLRNVVEEMAIASGMPPPELYLMERERGINAFAAGHGVRDAVICVTRGSLELLSRDELQGVVAHEFSHIRNGDVLLNLRLMGWLSGILVVSQAGEMIIRGMRRSSGRSAGIIFAAAAALYAIGYIGYFFGQLIKSAVSRQREFLGDACAVQFTRNPTGLAGALKKIGGLSMGSRLEHPRAAEVSHMFFGNGLENAWLHALDSHPSLEERIRLLEPGFDGSYPAVRPLPPPPAEAAAHLVRPAKAQPESVSALSGMAVAALLEGVEEPIKEHIDLARRLLSGLPESLKDASRNTFSACAMVYGLLMDEDPGVRKRQEQLVEEHDSMAAALELRRLLPSLAVLPPQVRLPLLDISLPALRSLSPDQFMRLKDTTGALSAADGRENLFEFTLRHQLLRHLEPGFLPRKAGRPVQIYGIRGVQKECSCILTTMARVGDRDEKEAQRAFARGSTVMNEPKADFRFLPAAECGTGSLEQAFTILDTTSPLIKRRLLAAALECMKHDRIIRIEEVEFFRAIADALGCPLPPWLEFRQGSNEVSQERNE